MTPGKTIALTIWTFVGVCLLKTENTDKCREERELWGIPPPCPCSGTSESYCERGDGLGARRAGARQRVTAGGGGLTFTAGPGAAQSTGVGAGVTVHSDPQHRAYAS